MNRITHRSPAARRATRRGAALLALTLGALTTAALAAPAAQADPAPAVPEVAVRLVDPAGDPVALAARFGATVVDTLVGLPGVHLLRAPDGTDVELLADALELDPAVDDATVNGPLFTPEVSGAGRIYGWSAQPPTAMGGQAAATVLGLAGLGAARGAGQVVAVLDTGVQLLPLPHPALAGALLPGIDLVDGDAVPDDARTGLLDPDSGVVDGMAGHGTHVAGIVRLVAPDARILPVRVLDATGRATMWHVVEGLLWAADHGATVVNASLGGRGSAGLVRKAVDELERRGVVVVAAAGNDARERDNFPASAGCAVSVAASDGGDAAAAFTTTGDRVTVAAPGVDVTSAHPFSPTGYAAWSGSSMAAPFAAGTAAVVRSVRPDLTPAAVQGILARTARPLTTAPPGGFGRLDPPAAVAAARLAVAVRECRS